MIEFFVWGSMWHTLENRTQCSKLCFSRCSVLRCPGRKFIMAQSRIIACPKCLKSECRGWKYAQRQRFTLVGDLAASTHLHTHIHTCTYVYQPSANLPWAHLFFILFFQCIYFLFSFFVLLFFFGQLGLHARSPSGSK